MKVLYFSLEAAMNPFIYLIYKMNFYSLVVLLTYKLMPRGILPILPCICSKKGMIKDLNFYKQQLRVV